MERPKNIEAERALLGSIILRPDVMYDISTRVSPESFFTPGHRTIYEALSDTFSAGNPIDIVSLTTKLNESNSLMSVGGASYVTELIETVPAMGNASYYADQVIDKYTRRNMMDVADKLRTGALDETVDTSVGTADVISILTNQMGSSNIDPSADAAIDSLRDQIKQFKLREGKYLGHESDIGALDKKLDGIRNGHFGVLTGYTSSGKTAFALNIACAFIKRGKKVVFFSLEMSPAQLVSRMAGIIAEVEIWKISKGMMNPYESERVAGAMKMIKDSGMTIYENPSIQSIEMTLLKESADKRTSLFILDYLGLVQSNMKSDYEGLKHVAQKFQSIMKSFNIHLLALSQINDAQIKDDNPFVISTKGSGDIGASADYVLRLKNREADLDIINGLKESGIPLPIQLYIQKNRHGPTGVINLYFKTETNQFLDEKAYDPKVFEKRWEIVRAANRSLQEELDNDF